MNDAPVTATEILRSLAELSAKRPPSALDAHYLKPLLDRLAALIQDIQRPAVVIANEYNYVVILAAPLEAPDTFEETPYRASSYEEASKLKEGLEAQYGWPYVIFERMKV